MVWVAVDEDEKEFVSEIFFNDRRRGKLKSFRGLIVNLPKGSIEKLIGRKLTWEDEPVKLQPT